MIKEAILTVNSLSKSNLIFLIFIIVLSVLFESFGFAMIVPLMEALLSSSSKSTIGELISISFGYFGLQMTVVNTSIVFALVMLMKNILKVYREYLRSEFSYQIKVNATEKIMFSYFSMPFGEFVKSKHGKLLNNSITETQHCAMGTLQLVELITGIVTVPIFILLLLLGSFELTLFLLLAACILYFSIRRFMNRYASYVGNKEIILNQQISSQVSENLSAMRHIRILGIKKVLIKQLFSKLKELKKLLVKWDVFTASTAPAIEFLMVLSMVCYFIFVSSYYGQEYFVKILPVISMMIIVAYKTMAQMSRLLTNKMALERYLPSMRLVNELLTAIPKKDSLRKNNFVVDYKESDINFSNVVFSYNKNKVHLDDISFTIQSKKNTVLMGPSGSGKSTIIDLLLGLYKPDSGKVEFGGVNIHDLDLRLWRQKIGYVSQDVFLFHASIEDNIRMADSKILSSEVRDMTKKVGLDKFIMELPDGYETIVGDRGAMLSGGQRQRVSIARALIMNPDILILDEATSALDLETAKELNKNIFSLMEGKTVFVVSHKKDVLKYADNVYYIDDGVLVAK